MHCKRAQRHAGDANSASMPVRSQTRSLAARKLVLEVNFRDRKRVFRSPKFWKPGTGGDVIPTAG